MAFVSPRMALKIWTDGSDAYAHEQLADNFLKLDIHDHSDGRGTPIGSDGIQDGAITTRHIYPGTITSDALDTSTRIPIGSVIDWYCHTPQQYATILLSNWRVCDGTTVAAGQHEIPGVTGAFTLPNLINKFTLGADPNKALNVNGNAGNTITDAPGVKGTGGSNAPHLHSVPGHTHSSGSLSTNTAGIHHHGYVSGTGVAIDAPWGSQVAVSDTSTKATTDDGAHSHTMTGRAGTGAVDGDVAFNSGTTDGRPAYVGLLKIMKVAS